MCKIQYCRSRESGYGSQQVLSQVLESYGDAYPDEE